MTLIASEGARETGSGWLEGDLRPLLVAGVAVPLEAEEAIDKRLGRFAERAGG